MFVVDDTFIDFESGEEAVTILFEELGQDFLNSYNKIKKLVMEKRIGHDYLLSRKINCSYPAFKEKFPNVDDNTFNLLTTDLVIRGEAILFLLKKQTGIDVMKRYHKIKKSIHKRELKKQKLKSELKAIEMKNSKKDQFWPLVKISIIKIVVGIIVSIFVMYY